MPDMSFYSSSELVWSVIFDVLENVENIKTTLNDNSSTNIWIPQAETSPQFFEVLSLLKSKNLELTQYFRPDALELKKNGYTSTQIHSKKLIDIALIVPTRQRIESLSFIAQALRNLKPSGVFIFACANNQGAGGYLKHFKEIITDLEAESSRKCRYFVVNKSQIINSQILDEWILGGNPITVPNTSFLSVPGIYGWNKIDQASEILISTLPVLDGHGADLGAGYAYLSHEVLKSSPNVSKMELLEADWRALECAQKNLTQWKNICEYHWLDVTAEETRSKFKKLDWVIMNPPFHEGSTANQDIGSSFIESASSALRTGGKLFMVANSFLAYEKTLYEKFSKVNRVLDKNGFKVIHAER